MRSPVEESLLAMLHGPALFWAERFHSQGIAVNPGRIADRVVEALCRNVRDARPLTTALYVETVRIVEEWNCAHPRRAGEQESR